MTIPGAGGQVPPRVDQQGVLSTPVPVSPGGRPVQRLILIQAATGAFQGLFLYSPSVGAGNLIASMTPNSGLDPSGNNYVRGLASYQDVFGTAVNIDIGQVNFLTGHLATGWATAGSLSATGSTFVMSNGFTSVGGAINMPQTAPVGPLTAPAAYNSGWGTSVVNAINNIISQLIGAGAFH